MLRAIQFVLLIREGWRIQCSLGSVHYTDLPSILSPRIISYPTHCCTETLSRTSMTWNQAIANIGLVTAQIKARLPHQSAASTRPINCLALSCNLSCRTRSNTCTRNCKKAPMRLLKIWVLNRLL